jgi:uncharacterized protein (DUF2147 family)
VNHARRFLARTVVGLVLAGSFPGGASRAAEPLSFEGVWRNPRDNVHLELRPCGALLCGCVVWASEAAKKSARRISKTDLIGKQLMRDFSPGDGHIGRGKVFVPDLGLTFGGTAERLDAETIKARGCVVGNLICKSQLWTRISGPPA